jgi:pyruvate/2-oxoglutarate dehydrogenase complex dihydrolipoamide dehydrogenase (E3) component/uncharacterized membrane protein YdjX (TVP38/TMEM64 family)
MKNKNTLKLLLAVTLVLLVVGFFYFDLQSYLSLDYLKSQLQSLQATFAERPIQFILGYAAIYILSTALSLPGASILTLAGGALFGFFLGTVIVSVCSTVGATLAFLSSRFLFRETVEKKFSEAAKKINEGIAKEGAFYLFTLRLLPIAPFFIVNLMMGLTKMRVLTYFFVSQIGMLAGTAAFVNAGTQVSQITSLKGILSPGLLFSFVVIGLLPLISKKIITHLKSRKYLKRFNKPKNFDYNLVVIGGGSAGLVTSYIAAAVKAKVALIEKHKLGGDCLNTGCVPSKAIIRSAKVRSLIERADEFGFSVENIKVDFVKVMERVQNVIKKIEPHDSVERYTSLGVECIQGSAKIKSPYEVEVNGRILTTKNIVVATGASPLVPAIKGLSEISFLTSDNVWNLRIQPKRLLVLGGGPIGCELAQSFARLGSKVILVERSERLMVREDADVSHEIENRFRGEGIEVLTSHEAVEFIGQKLICQHQGKVVDIEFDQVLLALGRKPNVKGFGLEELEIEISKSGTIETDEYLRTTRYPNIYTCGDVAGPYQFTHTASHQAWFAAVNSLFGIFKLFPTDYRVIPWCTFTDPEVARVGLNEIEAKQKNIPYEVTKYSLDDLDRAIAESEDHGFVKVLTVPGKDKILGVTIVGGHAGEIISEYVAAMKHGFGMNKILGTIHIYPTFAEANKYAAGVWKRNHVNAKLVAWVEKFHSFRR